jgi:hypothetical protein
VKALKRRELVLSQLKDALGCGEVLEAVLAEVAEPVVGQKRGGRCGHQHLPAMA